MRAMHMHPLAFLLTSQNSSAGLLSIPSLFRAPFELPSLELSPRTRFMSSICIHFHQQTAGQTRLDTHTQKKDATHKKGERHTTTKSDTASQNAAHTNAQERDECFEFQSSCGNAFFVLPNGFCGAQVEYIL